MTTLFQLSPNMELGHQGRPAFLSIPKFSLPTPGTYTLEGPNGSGKSMFIRLLTGTLPGGVDSITALSVQVEDRAIRLRSYRDALSAGIVAVFQDDDMISPMTVFENILLRHGNTDRIEIGNYVWRTFYNFLVAPTHHELELLGPAYPDWADKLFKKMHAPATDWKARKELRKKSLELLREHGVSANILDEVPPRLSGGGRAAARLVAAQLYKNTRVLLLDEPFNSVERNIWPTFLDSIKTWAETRKAAVLAISHNPAELVRWEPRVRFEIRNGILAEAETFAFGRKRRMPQLRQISVPIFEHLTNNGKERREVWESLWKRLDPERCVLFVEDWGRNSQFANDLLLGLPPGCTHSIVQVDDIQAQSTLDYLELLGGTLRDGRATDRTVVVIVGEKQSKAVAVLAALNDLSFNVVGTVVSLTSFGDAIDAVVLSRLELSSASAHNAERRVVVNANFFPEAFVVDFEYFRIPDNGQIRGLMNSLRLGLLLEKQLFERCEQALAQPRVELSVLTEVFHEVLALINESVDIDEGAVFRSLLGYGDIHARCIAEIANNNVSRADSLLLGMIVEAYLGDSKVVAQRLQELRKKLGVEFPAEVLDALHWERIEQVYIRNSTGRALRTTHLDELGQFNITSMRRQLATTGPETTGLYNRDVGAFVNTKTALATRQTDYQQLRSVLIQINADNLKHA